MKKHGRSALLAGFLIAAGGAGLRAAPEGDPALTRAQAAVSGLIQGYKLSAAA